MISPRLREELIKSICNLPQADSEAGRNALLAGLPIPLTANRDSDRHTDITNIVWTLDEWYGPSRQWRLLQFIDNAIASVPSNFQIGDDLKKIRQHLVSEERAVRVNWIEHAQIHFFDLSNIALMCLGQLPRRGGVTGFVIPGAPPSVLDNFRQSLPYRGERVRIWNRDHVFHKAPLHVGLLRTQVSKAIEALRGLDQKITTKHVAWTADLTSEADAEAIWESAKTMPAQRWEKHLIVIFGMPQDTNAPREMKVLECPNFERQDVKEWVEEIATAKSWDKLLIDRWTRILIAGPIVGEFPSTEFLYQNLDRFHRLLVDYSDDDKALFEKLVEFEENGGTF